MSINNIAASIGQKIRKYRKQQNMTLKELADRAGISQSMLSQIERGIACPTIISLVAIAGALAISAGTLFEDSDSIQNDTESPVYRSKKKNTLRTETGMTLATLTPRTELEDHTVQLAEVIIEPGGCNRLKPTAHEGIEKFAVLEGSFRVEIGADEYLLEQGDSITIKATLPHRLVNPGFERAHGVWLIITPRISEIPATK